MKENQVKFYNLYIFLVDFKLYSQKNNQNTSNKPSPNKLLNYDQSPEELLP
jgi:hypothetical protein